MLLFVFSILFYHISSICMEGIFSNLTMAFKIQLLIVFLLASAVFVAILYKGMFSGILCLINITVYM